MSINTYYLNRLIFLLLFSIASPSITIKGSIYDSKNKEPLIGASIFLEGTSFGTASDIDGSYSIKNIRSAAHSGIV